MIDDFDFNLQIYHFLMVLQRVSRKNEINMLELKMLIKEGAHAVVDILSIIIRANGHNIPWGYNP